jgi:hypothetical protein
MRDDLFRLIGWTVVDLFRSRAALEAEIWTLRQQINVLRRTAPRKLSSSHRLRRLCNLWRTAQRNQNLPFCLPRCRTSTFGHLIFGTHSRQDPPRKLPAACSRPRRGHAKHCRRDAGVGPSGNCRRTGSRFGRRTRKAVRAPEARGREFSRDSPGGVASLRPRIAPGAGYRFQRDGGGIGRWLAANCVSVAVSGRNVEALERVAEDNAWPLTT